MNRRRGPGVVALLLVASACSSAVQSATESPDEPDATDPTAAAATSEALSEPPATSAPTSAPTTTSTTTTPETTTATPTTAETTTTTTTSTTTTSTTTTSTTTTSTTTTTPSTTTTTTTLPPLDVYDPACVTQVQPGQTLDAIVKAFDDDSVDVKTVLAENGLTSATLAPEQLLDLCVDNGLDDIDGSTRTERNAVVARREVKQQQRQLNRLFADYGIEKLLVDGVSGPVTRQRLCAFRLAAGLPVSTADMRGGSKEERKLMKAESLPIPFTSAILEDRWILIDQTCQIMFVGVGTDRVQFVFPTSTGLAAFPTRTQVRSDAFKYNSASHNGGWHNSYDYPAAEDNPLNGNMYRPLYFDRGQAIHGANNVPRSPASHGCARLRVGHMDTLVNWLGLGDVRGATYDEGRINVTVNIQGRYEG